MTEVERLLHFMAALHERASIAMSHGTDEEQRVTLAWICDKIEDGFRGVFPPITDDLCHRASDEAYERAAQLCENSQSGHGKHKGGSDTGDAARRNCAIRIRQLKAMHQPSTQPSSERSV